MNIYPPGTRIAGRYEIASRPLMGGMGIVYLCNDLEKDRPVALKTFKPEFLPDRAARDRFLREGTAWVDLGSHPHIVRCYEVIQPGVALEVYLVLELVAKEQGREDASLRSWLPLRRGPGQAPGVPLPVEQALLFALQIARGMAHATATIPGFVHRDLKPENVLVGADHLSQARINRVRVTDFGLAAVLQEASRRIGESAPGDRQGAARDPLSRTQLTHGIVGTPLYMAPEQWHGEGVTVATDVYALGCILYEMVTGQRAVVGNSLAALQRAHCQGEVRPLPQDLSAAVGPVLARCLAVNPDKRHASWEETEAALVTAYEQLSGQAAPSGELLQALDRAERVAEGWSYNAIGLSYQDIGKFNVAMKYFERVIQIGQMEKESVLEGAGLCNLGLAYRSIGEAQRAIGYFKQALTIAREIGDRVGEGRTLSGLGTAYANLGDIRQAIGFFEQHLTVARGSGDWHGAEHALGNLGLAHYSLGEARRAMGYFNQALTIAREIGDRAGEGKTLLNLGNTYRALGDTRQAIGFFEQALAIVREIGDRAEEGIVLGSLGIAYLNLDKAQRAIGLFEKSLAIAREIGDRHSEGTTLSNLGNAYGNLSKPQRAIGLFEKSLAIAQEIGDVRGAATTSYNLAKLLFEQNRRTEALRYAEYSAQVFTQIGHAQRAQQARQLIAQIRAALR